MVAGFVNFLHNALFFLQVFDLQAEFFGFLLQFLMAVLQVRIQMLCFEFLKIRSLDGFDIPDEESKHPEKEDCQEEGEKMDGEAMQPKSFVLGLSCHVSSPKVENRRFRYKKTLT